MNCWEYFLSVVGRFSICVKISFVEILYLNLFQIEMLLRSHAKFRFPNKFQV